ncbi:hypothetical protein [Variovorax paradoxus]|uniref:hypothetical protein n=1 Tax=Variovorax paradoxus TaxID=34073 RepID=UPI0029C854ED|nr:hypothetical protein RZE77_03075 [Variovorax paradoxus]
MKEPRPTKRAEVAEPAHLFSWQQVAAALFAANGIKSGWWRLGVQLRFAAITTRMAEPGQVHQAMPTGMVGVDKVAVYEVSQGGDMVFDASRNAEPVPVSITGVSAVTPANTARKAPKVPASKGAIRKITARKRAE